MSVIIAAASPQDTIAREGFLPVLPFSNMKKANGTSNK